MDATKSDHIPPPGSLPAIPPPVKHLSEEEEHTFCEDLQDALAGDPESNNPVLSNSISNISNIQPDDDNDNSPIAPSDNITVDDPSTSLPVDVMNGEYRMARRIFLEFVELLHSRGPSGSIISNAMNNEMSAALRPLGFLSSVPDPLCHHLHMEALERFLGEEMNRTFDNAEVEVHDGSSLYHTLLADEAKDDQEPMTNDTSNA